MTAGYAHNELTHCSFKDWAYVEDFARRLTTPFSDVYVFTVPLYLPKQERDGKWRVVSTWQARLTVPKLMCFPDFLDKTYEVIGSQSGGTPSVAVPTHFA